MFERYFADDLDFDEIVEPGQISKRTFKKKCGSSTTKIGNISYLKSTDGKNLYPISCVSTAHKPYNAPKKTVSKPRFSVE